MRSYPKGADMSAPRLQTKVFSLSNDRHAVPVIALFNLIFFQGYAILIHTCVNVYPNRKDVNRIMPFLMDCHCHSDSSPDSKTPVSEHCEQALALNISTLCITDHCEANVYTEEGYDKTIRRSLSQTREAQTAFKNLEILTGMELGQPMQGVAHTNHALEENPCDFVLGSLHNVAGRPDFYFLDLHKENIPELLNTYFSELLDMIRWGRFDSLAHLTYPWRYLAAAGLSVPFSDYKEQLDEILQALVRQNIALEINTSGLRQDMRQAMPSGELVNRYVSLGGRLITIGSDAHRAEDLGKGLLEAVHMVRMTGLEEITVYRKREPYGVNIEKGNQL